MNASAAKPVTAVKTMSSLIPVANTHPRRMSAYSSNGSHRREQDSKVGIEIAVPSRQEPQQQQHQELQAAGSSAHSRRHFLPQIADRMDPNLVLEAMTSFSVGSSFGTATNNDNTTQRSSRKESARRKNKDSTTAERARNRLKKHGADDADAGGDGNEAFCFYPKTAPFLSVRELVGGAYATGGGIGNSLVHWLAEPLGLTPEDLESVYRCTVAYPMFEMFQCGGVLVGLKGEEEGTNGEANTNTARTNRRSVRRKSRDSTSNSTARRGSNSPQKQQQSLKDEQESIPPLQACVVFREYDPAKEGKKGVLRRMVGLMSHTCAYLEKKDTSGISLLLCDRKQMKLLGNFMSRADTFEEKAALWHATYGPKGLHWYLSDVATKVQRRGQGSRLLTALTQMADRYEMDIYLECPGDGPVGFFTKFDFIVAGVEELIFENKMDEVSGEPKVLQIHLMVRKASLVVDTSYNKNITTTATLTGRDDARASSAAPVVPYHVNDVVFLDDSVSGDRHDPTDVTRDDIIGTMHSAINGVASARVHTEDALKSNDQATHYTESPDTIKLNAGVSKSGAKDQMAETDVKNWNDYIRVVNGSESASLIPDKANDVAVDAAKADGVAESTDNNVGNTPIIENKPKTNNDNIAKADAKGGVAEDDDDFCNSYPTIRNDTQCTQKVDVDCSPVAFVEDSIATTKDDLDMSACSTGEEGEAEALRAKQGEDTKEAVATSTYPVEDSTPDDQGFYSKMWQPFRLWGKQAAT